MLLCAAVLWALQGRRWYALAVASAQDDQQWPELVLTPYLSGLENPVQLTHAGDGSGRVFVVEQAGRIRIARDGVLLPTPFLDISDRLACCGERGLLSVAFPRDYATKGRFYVDYTDRTGTTIVARYHLGQNLDTADPASEEVVLTVAQPFANHNGGQLAFGPLDGYLYIGMGDGGSGGDPQNHGQNPASLLGKMLRIDVEAGLQPYGVPPTNPFAQTPGYRAEIWALGLRNPWRFSFDREKGDLYIGDVGQEQYEEIDLQPASSSGGENYGWRIMEGGHCYRSQDCDQTGLVLPVAEYDHSRGCSVAGGVVYRGGTYPRMQGIYLYGDYCSGRIWGLRQRGGQWQSLELLDTAHRINSFGEDEVGNAYVVDYGGNIYLLADTMLATPTATASVTPEPTVSPTSTPTLTDVPTPTVLLWRPIFLPIILKQWAASALPSSRK
jgi:glucose/arabinose dehydrogenase